MDRIAEELRVLAGDLYRKEALEHGRVLAEAHFELLSLPKKGAEDDSEGPDDYKEAMDFLNQTLTKFPKRSGWWKPPNNLAINSAIMGFNFWEFSILQTFATKGTYRPKTDRLPEGIVVRPMWIPAERMKDKTYPHTRQVAELGAKMMDQAPTVAETVKAELKWIETYFKVSIPDQIQSKLLKECIKIASRRWGVDRLRVRKTLIPFDGSKAVELGSWD